MKIDVEVLENHNLQIGDLACSVKNFSSDYYRFFKVDSSNIISCLSGGPFVVIKKKELDSISKLCICSSLNVDENNSSDLFQV